MARGGRQIIPRPDDWRSGSMPEWRDAAADQLTMDRIRAVFDGRVGAASPLEAAADARSAVLAAWYELNGEPHVVLTRRPWHMRIHAGEVSFPGGSEEPGDATLAYTALREACEEIGLDRSTVTILGELDHLMTLTNRLIVPFVAVLDAPPTDLRRQEDEVEEILHVPVSDLVHPDAFHGELWPSVESDHPIVFFDIEGDTIWGATGALLDRFLGLTLTHG